MTPVIEFRQVGLVYPGPPPKQALVSCDLMVRQGEFVTVVGPSGSGKSTFLNIAGLTAGILQRPARSALTALDTVLGVGTFVAVLGLTATTPIR